MARVVGIDHLVLSVGNFARSKDFYRKVLGFLGFKLKHEYPDMAGWSNGKTLFWIAAADAKGKKHKYRKGDIGFHHYAFELSSRKDVDALGAFLVEHGLTVVDPPGEYYEPSYYAVYFTDPDGMKLEGMVFKPPPKKSGAEAASKEEGQARVASSCLGAASLPVSCPGRVQRARLRERNETRDPARHDETRQRPSVMRPWVPGLRSLTLARPGHERGARARRVQIRGSMNRWPWPYSRCQTAQCYSFPRRVAAPGLVSIHSHPTRRGVGGAPTGALVLLSRLRDATDPRE